MGSVPVFREIVIKNNMTSNLLLPLKLKTGIIELLRFEERGGACYVSLQFAHYILRDRQLNSNVT
jgi:hypothetical protein